MQAQAPSIPIIKLTDSRGRTTGYQVGQYLIGGGAYYRPLSGNGPGGFSPNFGLALAQAPQPQRQEISAAYTTPQRLIRYHDLSRWNFRYGCSNCGGSARSFSFEDTDEGRTELYKCVDCGRLHRR